MLYIHAMNYYSVTKRNEILTHDTTRMYTENIMFSSEMNQTHKDNIV